MIITSLWPKKSNRKYIMCFQFSHFHAKNNLGTHAWGQAYFYPLREYKFEFLLRDNRKSVFNGCHGNS